jgi:SAM-dependent methyltransferase
MFELFKKEKEYVKELAKEAKELAKIEGLRDDFFNILLLLPYSKNKKSLVKKAKKIAEKVPELKGWPDDVKKFWDIESFGWQNKIPLAIRETIKKELRKRAKGKHIELGSGSYPYVNKSILVDFSEEMLANAPKEHKKIVHDLDKDLPFKDNSFDSASAVFLVDYLDNFGKTLKEIRRILKKNGNLIIVQSKKPITNFYHYHEKRFWSKEQLKSILTANKFKPEVNELVIGNSKLVVINAKCL